MRTRGDARSVGGAVVRGVLRAAVLVTLGVIGLLFTRDEPLGNRAFLGSISALMFAVAGWGVIETRRELRRLRRR